MNDLIAKFNFSKVLTSNPQTKSIVLLGQIDGEDAIVSIEKSHFISSDESPIDLTKLVQDLRLIQQNDIYSWSLANLAQDIESAPGAKLNVVYPATETHIRKYSQQKLHYVVETPEMYRNFVEPYIETMKGDRIKWVYNILFEGKEAESVIYHDKDPESGFVLLPDMKWDAQNMDSLYLCCIVNRKDIASVRDIRGKHASFLSGVQQRIKQLVEEKYPVKGDEVRIFIHYQPSYYHFHIHVVNVKHPGLGDGIAAGKAILLDDVIENVKLMDDYYEKRRLGYIIGENHGLWNWPGYQEAHEKNGGK